MELLLLLINLAGAAALLLWAVRMVRTGVEKVNGGALRRYVRRATVGKIRAAGIGGAVAMLLQSSTAVAVLAAGFASAGIVSVSQGLALLLGADLGSAIVVQILSFDLSWLMPFLLLVGGGLSLNGSRRVVLQAGKIMLGIGLVLLSLRLMSEATIPLRDSEFLRVVTGFLKTDPVSSFLIGAVFTWLLHSSVASVLLIVTLVMQGVLPLNVGLALMLGANFGAGLIAVGLTRNQEPNGRRIPVGNLVCRGIGAIIALLALSLVVMPVVEKGEISSEKAAAWIVYGHVLFNGLLVIVCLPLLGLVETITRKLVVNPPVPLGSDPVFQRVSALDHSVIHLPKLALASATRELLRMSDIVELMVRPIMDFYDTYDKDRATHLINLDLEVNKAHSSIKLYLADLSESVMDNAEADHSVELANFAINLEAAGDIASKNMLELAERKYKDKLEFSEQGRKELVDLHEQVLTNMQLALNVLVSGDRGSARQLVEEKDRMRDQERKSNVQHLRRLQSGAVESIETSAIHLDTARALRQINSLFASIAYPILSQTGDLLQSRLARSKDQK